MKLQLNQRGSQISYTACVGGYSCVWFVLPQDALLKEARDAENKVTHFSLIYRYIM